MRLSLTIALTTPIDRIVYEGEIRTCGELIFGQFSSSPEKKYDAFGQCHENVCRIELRPVVGAFAPLLAFRLWQSNGDWCSCHEHDPTYRIEIDSVSVFPEDGKT